MATYYNLSLQNPTDASIPLKFDVSLNIPFIKKPSDYDVSIVRFVLPNFETPLLTFSDNFYKMYMSYNGSSVNQFIQFVSRDSNSSNRSVWDMAQIIQMLNATIGTLYTALDAIVTLPTSDMPYFTYSETSKLITFTANKNYFASSLATPIVISFNSPLLTWLFGLPSFGRIPDALGVPTVYDLLVIDLKNNTVSTNYYAMTAQAPSTDILSDFDRVVITSNLPIANEYSGTATALPIIQDYTPGDLDVSTFYNKIVYNAVTPYRQTRLIGDSAFYSIRMDCYVQNSSGTLFPMLLPPHQGANIKIMFTEHDRNNYA